MYLHQIYKNILNIHIYIHKATIKQAWLNLRDGTPETTLAHFVPAWQILTEGPCLGGRSRNATKASLAQRGIAASLIALL